MKISSARRSGFSGVFRITPFAFLSTGVARATRLIFIAPLILLLALPFPARSAQSVSATSGEVAPALCEAVFGFSNVEDLARKSAEMPYEKLQGKIPDFLSDLKAEQWARIRFKQKETIWRGEGLPFEIQMYHPGFIYTGGVRVHVVENGCSTLLECNSASFDYHDPALAEKAAQAKYDFAGFRLFSTHGVPKSASELVSFLGATRFRSKGKEADYGVHAQGVTINTAVPGGEEFPYFSEFWIVKPQADDTSITVYALMNSPSMAGAYCFTIRPGTSTVMDVESKLFARKNAAKPQKIGLAPLSSMFLFSETGSDGSVDYRPEVHNSDGLLSYDGSNWLWRPLVNPARLGITAFPMENTLGFGLMQRDNNFDHYQDIGARFERRGSLWVEPVGNWGRGHVELIEIPTRNEVNDNILVFWTPEKPEERQNSSGDEPEKEPGSQPGVLSSAYRLYWMTPGVTPHSLGRVAATRMIRNSKESVRFILDFESETLKALPAETGLTSRIGLPDSTSLLAKKITKNPVTGGWRLDFSVRIPSQEGVVQSLLSVRDGQGRLTFSASLSKGENLPDPLTEIWCYDMPL